MDDFGNAIYWTKAQCVKWYYFHGVWYYCNNDVGLCFIPNL